MLDVDCFDFDYPAKKSCYTDFTEAKRNRQDAKKVLYSAFNRNILSVKTTRKHFCVVSNYVNGE
jgi:hypothetical protein